MLYVVAHVANGEDNERVDTGGANDDDDGGQGKDDDGDGGGGSGGGGDACPTATLGVLVGCHQE